VAAVAFRARLMLYATAQFVVLTVLAMFAYAGGAQYSLDCDHYLFFQNFFSDLGATKTYSGRSNTLSHVLFTVALASVGLALLAFAPSWRVIVARRRARRRAGIASQVSALISGVGFIGIAATPWDHFLDAHNNFVRLAFAVLLAYMLCLTAVQVANAWPRPYIVANAVYLVILVGYVIILFAGPGLHTLSGLRLQVGAQKVIVYSSIVAIALQAVGILRHPVGEAVGA
jgi:hypothetical protein